MVRRDKRQRASKLSRERSARLRANSTFPEQLLWSVLRGKQLGGVRFRRQHPIEPYIVDFYCASARLAIELDGQSHDGRDEYDNQRTHDIENQSIRVLRVSNDDVLNNLDGVLELISRAVGLGPIASDRAPRFDAD
jgi:very-short-patch-repair endonuclease